MNTHDIELPPLPQGEYRLSPDSLAPTLYDEEAMEAYARAAIEADRKRRDEPVAWGAFYFGGKRTGKLYSHTETEAQIDAYIADVHRSNDSITLRKGPLYTAPQPAEPVKVPSDAELLACAGVSKHGDMPAIFGTADIRRFAECILKHFGQRPAEQRRSGGLHIN